jgi:hypothetical protein
VARLSELEREAAPLRKLVDVTAEMLGTLPTQLTLGVVAPAPAANEGADYSNMPHSEAAKDVIRRARGGPIKTGPITEALLAGGVKTESKFFRNNVNTMLMRMMRDPASGIGKTKWGWTLKE